MSGSFFDARSGYPIRDEITGELVENSDGEPITELEGHDYLELASALSIEERSAGERAWRYGHVIVDEAQDLTPMQWRMVSRRARGHSMTLVGDLAQRSVGDSGSWSDLLPAELGAVAEFELTTNYRSPSEVSELAGRILARLSPDLSAPIAIRSSGHPIVVRRSADLTVDLGDMARTMVASLDGGRLAVIGIGLPELELEGVVVFTPRAAKGLEFDAVIVVEPAAILDEPNGLSLLYVAITRTTDRLVVVHERELPDYFPE